MKPRELLHVKLMHYKRHYKKPMVLALTLAWTIWLALGQARLWDRDEPRNARCAVEMLDRGDWIVPMFNDQLRTHKPILLYWLQMASYSLFGISEFAARFGSAMCASACVIAMYWFGRRTVSGTYGLWCGVVLASCMMFVVAARAATPDAVLIGTSAIGILALAMQCLSRNNDQASNFSLGYIGYFALGMAVLAKGPVGIVIPFAVLGTWTFLQTRIEVRAGQKYRFKTIFTRIWQVFQQLRPVRGLAIIAAISVPWYIWVGLRTNGDWLVGFFIEHNLQRAVSAMEGHSGGVWYYPVAMLAGVFPWSLMLIPIAMWSWSNVQGKAISPIVQLGLVWVALTLIAFSCASTKLPSYITTCYPGAALLIGGCFFHWQTQRFVLPVWLSKTAGGVIGATAIALLIGLPIAAYQLKIPPLAVCSIAAVGLFIPATLLMLRNFDPSRVALSFAASAVILVGTMLGLGPAILSSYRSDLDQLVALDSHQSAQWLAIGTIEPSWVFYRRHAIEELKSEPIADNARPQWLDRSITHLRVPSNRLILGESDLGILRQFLLLHADSKNESPKLQLETILQTKRFISNKSLSVVRGITIDTEVARLASKPKSN